MRERKSWGEDAYAGFWRRAGARLIDWILVGVVTGVLAMAVGLAFGVALLASGSPEPMTSGQQAGLTLVFWLIFLLPEFLYDTLMTSRLGWTLGKRAVGIEVRHASGDLLTFWQAVGRYFGRIVSSLPLWLGFLWAAWDAHKQTWHDKFVSCYVLKRDDLAAHTPAASAAERPWGGYTGWGIPGAPRADLASSPPREAEPAGQRLEGAPARTTVVTSQSEDSWGFAAHEEPQASGVTQEAPAAGSASDWSQELDWTATGSVVEGESLESARWSGATAAATEAPEAPTEAPEAPGEATEPVTRATPDADTPATLDADTPATLDADTPATADPDVGSGAGAVAFDPGVDDAASADVARATPGREPAASNPNVAAVERAAVAEETASWLREVSEQVDDRLDRVAPGWRESPQSHAAHACAFGLLLGRLATVYPHMADDLGRVAEAHASFASLGEGDRLATLQEIASDAERAGAWLGPLAGAGDDLDVQPLLD